MSRDLGRDVPDLEKLYAGKLWADFCTLALMPGVWKHPRPCCFYQGCLSEPDMAIK